VTPFLNPIILTFAGWGNYIAHFAEVLKGNDKFVIPKLFMPMQVALFMYTWGPAWGFFLAYINASVIGIYYFTCALMNHNAEHITNAVDKRNKARDWGEAQLHSSADWGV